MIDRAAGSICELDFDCDGDAVVGDDVYCDDDHDDYDQIHCCDDEGLGSDEVTHRYNDDGDVWEYVCGRSGGMSDNKSRLVCVAYNC